MASTVPVLKVQYSPLTILCQFLNNSPLTILWQFFCPVFSILVDPKRIDQEPVKTSVLSLPLLQSVWSPLPLTCFQTAGTAVWPGERERGSATEQSIHRFWLSNPPNPHHHYNQLLLKHPLKWWLSLTHQCASPPLTVSHFRTSQLLSGWTRQDVVTARCAQTEHLSIQWQQLPPKALRSWVVVTHTRWMGLPVPAAISLEAPLEELMGI